LFADGPDAAEYGTSLSVAMESIATGGDPVGRQIGNKERARQDSNLQPMDSKSIALSIELRAHIKRI
jgi:hypothetical protein